MYYCDYCKANFTTHNHKIMHEEDCPYRDATQGHKRCKKCGEEKLLEEYSICSARFDKLNGHCKDCVKSYHRRWLANL